MQSTRDTHASEPRSPDHPWETHDITPGRKVRLHLDDAGQDFLWFDVDLDLSEIVGAGPFQDFAWSGRSVAPEVHMMAPHRRPADVWKAGDVIAFPADGTTLNYRVKSVEVVK